MGERKYKNLVIRGEKYASAAEAAAALGVVQNTVIRAARLGKLDTVGLGQRGKPRMRVSIRGKVYRDASAAAVALGVSESLIYTALHRGSMERVGLPRRGGARSKPFSICGLRWPSMRAASLELGFPANFVSQAIMRDRKGAQQEILAAAMSFAEREGVGAKQKAELGI